MPLPCRLKQLPQSSPAEENYLLRFAQMRSARRFGNAKGERSSASLSHITPQRDLRFAAALRYRTVE
ncbi:MAG: hypothetical protein ICV55_11070 [Coleofasciculus sp. C3-bin4]|nr:hypothetical protein [Coleofasciculus sp. C3-bin4]